MEFNPHIWETVKDIQCHVGIFERGSVSTVNSQTEKTQFRGGFSFIFGGEGREVRKEC